MRLLISGLPGPMAEAVARTALAEEIALTPWALSSDGHEGQHHKVEGHRFALVGPAKRNDRNLSDLIAIDFSTPQAALPNARWFAARGIPFVMGTTGGDLEAIERAVSDSSISAVVAPNMAAPLVLLQAAFANLADSFPDSLSGHHLRITESHQASKRDTSGTAKAMAAHLEAMGLPASIEKIRDPERSVREMGVPEKHLGGHAFHTYRITSPGEDVEVTLQHNVLGREVYARGAVQALRFLQRRLETGSRGEVFSMIDVLSGAA